MQRRAAKLLLNGCTPPDHLIVLRLGKDGEAADVFNGPGASVWSHCGAMQKNGQRAISFFKLRKLMLQVLVSQQVPGCK